MFRHKLFCLPVFFLAVGLVILPPNAQCETGITESKIRLGQSLPMTGLSAPRALAFNAGSDLYFKKINDTGGINGRKIEVVRYDDGYDPVKTVANAKRLINEDKVFALFDVFGTPTVKSILPLVESQNIPLITPISSGRFLRNPVLKNVFVLRPSDTDEMEAIVKFLTGAKGLKNISIFYQDDALGQSGKAGLQRALDNVGLKLKSEAVYSRNTSSVDKQIDDIRATKPDAVFVWAVAITAGEFVKKSVEKGLKPVFVVSSIADTPEFFKQLGASIPEIYLAQSLPFLAEANTNLVKDFLKDTEKAGVKSSISEFEGYFNAAFLTEALRHAGKDVTRATLINAIEDMKSIDIGGINLTFAKDDHEGSSRIVMTKAEKGRFVIDHK
jgi:branched-chain amino acid transport system substrate-binding protein